MKLSLFLGGCFCATLVGLARAQSPAAPAGSPSESPAPNAAPAMEQPKPLSAPPLTEDEQALLKLEQDWGEATKKGDVAAIDRSEAEEYIYTDPNGQISHKHDSLEAAKAGGAKITSFQIRDMKVHVYGEAAVLTGQTQLKAKDESGGEISVDYRWTDVFVHRDGRWQAVASQATAIQTVDAPENASAATAWRPPLGASRSPGPMSRASYRIEE